jgi:predicted nucleotidyltransferase/uncharacterized protein (DUF433 family)
MSERRRAISRDPAVHSGDVVFGGTRVPVDTLVDVLKGGGTVDEFLEGHPSVERWQVEAVLQVPDAPVRPSRALWHHRVAVLALLDEHGVADPRLFGSVVRGDDEPGSDLDLLVDLPDGATLIDWSGLRLDLEDLLGCGVDVVMYDGLRGESGRRIRSEAVRLDDWLGRVASHDRAREATGHHHVRSAAEDGEPQRPPKPEHVGPGAASATGPGRAEDLRGTHLRVTERDLVVTLEDGSSHAVPIALHPVLADAPPQTRQKYEALGDGTVWHWPRLGERISTAAIVDPERGYPLPPGAALRRILSNRHRAGSDQNLDAP